MKKWLIFTLGLFAMVGLGLTAAHAYATTQKLTVVGATSLKPLLRPNAALTVTGGGSTLGLRQVAAGKADIAASDITTNARQLVDHPIAVNGIAVITGVHTGIKNLTTTQLQALFSGRVTNWQQVGGLDQAVTVIDRNADSGTRANFALLALNDHLPHATHTVSSAATMQQLVTKTPGAIGYVTFSQLTKTTHTVSLNHVAPTIKNVTTNAYPLWAYAHLYTNGAPDYRTAKVIHAIQQDQKAITNLHMIPLKQMQVARTKDGQIEDTH